ncbi:MAG: hypothetical protein QF632_02205, partial [Candidatus Woesearchaeota archaeon]|nr:hypothetical protein [Candidatus Woesearchaeota archaeon]
IATEPTFSKFGKKIRFEMIKSNTSYTPEQIARAIADDRKEQCEKAILPALEQGKIVIQERCVIASLVYQSLMDGLTKEFILNLEGNKFGLDHAPEILVITTVKAEVAIKRLKSRQKKDDAIFEKLEFLKKTEELYESSYIEDLMNPKGTKVIRFDTNPPKTVEDTKTEMISILKKYL